MSPNPRVINLHITSYLVSILNLAALTKTFLGQLGRGPTHNPILSWPSYQPLDYELHLQQSPGMILEVHSLKTKRMSSQKGTNYFSREYGIHLNQPMDFQVPFVSFQKGVEISIFFGHSPPLQPDEVHHATAAARYVDASGERGLSAQSAGGFV